MSVDQSHLLAWRDAAAAGFRYHKNLADRAIEQTSDEALRRPLDEHTNSIAVIMKHVGGNLRSRWTDVLEADGEKPWRNRDAEFVDDFASREEVLDAWETGWSAVLAALDSLTEADLDRTITIRGEPHSVALAVERSLAHTSYHVGQIVLLARHYAGDAWNTLTIPRGESAAHNRSVWGGADYLGRSEPTS